MTRHLLCLTVDTDPDGLSGKVTNRDTLRFEGLKHLQCLPSELASHTQLSAVPLTWFVRADGQLETMLGSADYLLNNYESFWAELQRAGHELAWHPHLYRQWGRNEPAVLISDPIEAEDELERLWHQINGSFQPQAFRNGEGWHVPQTYAAIEHLGFGCDSTAIPGRRGSNGHPMNWESAPNQPYFPAPNNLSAPGAERPMLELPMNTWFLRGPDDPAPRLRYMNPAVHPCLFAEALKSWENACIDPRNGLAVWVMIFHPDEVDSNQAPDPLYSRSRQALCENLIAVTQALTRLEHQFEWSTISNAALQWRRHKA